MSQALQSYLRTWWRTALLFLLTFIVVNALISFILSKVYPSHCVRTSDVPLHIQDESLEMLDDPRQLYLHVDTPLLPLGEKDIVVRSAYVQVRGSGRDLSAGHKNSTIILLEVKKSIVEEKAFESCGVGSHVSTKFEVIPIASEGCSPGGRFTHVQALLYCHDVPASHLDRAWVAYRKTLFEGKVSTFQAMSEHPVLLHNRGPRGGVVVCAAMLPHYMPYVEDWIRYQNTVGVDHVHLTLESTFLNLGRFDRDFLQRAVEESYLSVDFWHQWLNETDICDHSLDLALYDCALRFQDSHSHVIFSDPRDFFIPRNPSLPHMRDYLSQWCSTTHCQFKWRNWFYRRCEKPGSSGNVTAVIPVTNFGSKGQKFTVYRLAQILPSDGQLFVLDSSNVASVPVESAYVAHLGRFANASDMRILPQYESCS